MNGRSDDCAGSKRSSDKWWCIDDNGARVISRYDNVGINKSNENDGINRSSDDNDGFKKVVIIMAVSNETVTAV